MTETRFAFIGIAISAAVILGFISLAVRVPPLTAVGLYVGIAFIEYITGVIVIALIDNERFSE